MFTKQDIERYFIAEKQESLIFIIIGGLAIVLALVAWFYGKASFFRGAAIPLLIVGLIQGIVGYTVYKRSDDDRVRNVYAYDMNPGQLKSDELPRMEKVNKNFDIYFGIEVALAVLGVVLVIYFRRKPAQLFWYGFGVALAIQALVMLTADYFAEKRADKYTAGIEEFVKGK
jgi:predicted membrane channel-forming protein YqfA (hemolysin III family)